MRRCFSQTSHPSPADVRSVVILISRRHTHTKTKEKLTEKRLRAFPSQAFGSSRGNLSLSRIVGETKNKTLMTLALRQAKGATRSKQRVDQSSGSHPTTITPATTGPPLKESATIEYDFGVFIVQHFLTENRSNNTLSFDSYFAKYHASSNANLGVLSVSGETKCRCHHHLYNSCLPPRRDVATFQDPIGGRGRKEERVTNASCVTAYKPQHLFFSFGKGRGRWDPAVCRRQRRAQQPHKLQLQQHMLAGGMLPSGFILTRSLIS